MPIRNYICLLMFAAFIIVIPVYAQIGEPGAPGVGDSLYPNFGNGGYDVEHYKLDITVDPEVGVIVGVTTIDAVATQDLSSFNLDLVGFEIRNIWVDAERVKFSRDGQELTITPNTPLAAGDEFSTVVMYSGTPERMDSTAYDGQTGWITYRDGIYVMSEPDGAASFYPVNDHPLDKAEYSLHITVPEPYRVATNGVVSAVIDHGGTTTTISEVHQPMASYLTTINIARFELVEARSGNGVPIRSYFEQGVSAEARAIVELQGAMLDYYESLFGAYPFDVYGAVVVNTETESALEAQTLSLFGVDTFEALDPLESELFVAHELAHQWFGDSVTAADWSDVWLHEGWATYCEGLWIEHTDGGQAFAAWVNDLYDYMDEESDDFSPPGAPPADDLLNDSVYVWGALTLHALRLEAGDDAFFEIARTWLERYQYDSATTADFIDVVNEITGEEYGDFFDDWLYSGDLPALR